MKGYGWPDLKSGEFWASAQDGVRP